MGRAARMKRQRRQDERREAWRELVSVPFLKRVRAGILRSGASVDSCICSTKVAVQLGELRKIRVEPLVVEASVFNPVFTQYIREHEGLDSAAARALGEQGGRVVVLGCRRDRAPSGPNKWPGHLVAIAHPPGEVGGAPYLLDLSIDQAHRPQKSIIIDAPLAFPVSQDFLEGKSSTIRQMESAEGLMCFVYRAEPEDRSYEVSRDWHRNYVVDRSGGS